jgi:hypothetical protein
MTDDPDQGERSIWNEAHHNLLGRRDLLIGLQAHHPHQPKEQFDRKTILLLSVAELEPIACPTIAPVARSTAADRARTVVRLAHLKISTSP